jgi:C4-dicarboxylate-specific signal transduction histidine kinase
MWESIKKGDTWKGNIKNRKKDGGYYWVEANIEPIFDENSKIVSYMAVRKNITSKIKLDNLNLDLEKIIEQKTKELKLLTENLENKVKEEIEKNTEKEKHLLHQSRLAQIGEMISMIAHQWRQPLAAISSSSSSLNFRAVLNRADNDFIISTTDRISEYSQYLSSTIDDFREFFKDTKEKKETNFELLTNSALKIIDAALEDKDIVVVKDLKCKDDFYTYSNELKQVILNLIKNAEDILVEKNIKYPCIKIVSYRQSNKIFLEISDNARGVPQNIIHKIFDPYFSTKKQKDGTGLGLYMSKMIVEDNCGGKLSVTNNKQGAVFKIELDINS